MSTSNSPQRALFINYYFPPSNAPGSLQRLRLIKNMAKFGWEIVVLTTSHSFEFGSMSDVGLMDELPNGLQVYRARSWEMFSEYRAPLTLDDWRNRFNPSQYQSLIKRIVHRVFSILREKLKRLTSMFIPDDKTGWVIPAYLTATRLLSEQHFDTIVTMAMPHSSHLIGYLLKTVRPNLRWVAYSEDPWTLCEYVDRPKWQMHLGRMKLERWLERKVFEKADHNIVNTSVSRLAHMRLIPSAAHKISVVTCSFDPMDLETIKEKPRERFRIQYLGRFFGARTPRYFLQGLRQLLDRRPELWQKLEIRFTGNFGWDPEYGKWNRAYISDYGLESIVITESSVSHREGLKRLADSDATLVIGAPIASDGLYIPSKIFEYIAAGKPVLALVASPGATTKLIHSLGCGQVAARDGIAAISQAIENLYDGRNLVSNQTIARKFLDSSYGPYANAQDFFTSLSGSTQPQPLHMTHNDLINLLPLLPLPGYVLRNYQLGDELAWSNLLSRSNLGNWTYERVIQEINRPTFDPQGLFFLIHQGQIIGTAGSLWNADCQSPELHLVAIDSRHLGKNLGRHLANVVLHYFAGRGKRRAVLRTDAWQLPAIKGYLQLGFLPKYVNEDDDQRWQQVADDLDIPREKVFNAPGDL